MEANWLGIGPESTIRTHAIIAIADPLSNSQEGDNDLPTVNDVNQTLPTKS